MARRTLEQRRQVGLYLVRSEEASQAAEDPENAVDRALDALWDHNRPSFQRRALAVAEWALRRQQEIARQQQEITDVMVEVVGVLDQIEREGR